MNESARGHEQQCHILTMAILIYRFWLMTFEDLPNF